MGDKMVAPQNGVNKNERLDPLPLFTCTLLIAEGDLSVIKVQYVLLTDNAAVQVACQIGKSAIEILTGQP